MPATGPSYVRMAALVALCGACIWNALTPPRPAPVTASATAFSAERALAHTRAIAQRPHPIGSEEAARVRTYLIGELTTLGLAVDSQDVTAVGTRYQALGHVRNLVARIPGTTPGGPAILLLSHYDGVPAGPAASDAGSGVSVLLETARALRAGTPLVHDVIIAITDGEEAGLLGASAFVREHRWAKDVAVTLNFEARGTTGRAVMFETGPGNLDLVRVLSQVRSANASSLAVTVYRTMNNDTDLSEVARLDRPALNFAFAGGVERYHTTEDDIAHANGGAIQQEGDAALAVVRTIGMEPLPRPVTRDAVFSDIPLLGIVHYDESLARPVMLAILALLCAALVLLRRNETHWARDTALGVLLTILAVALAAAAAFGGGMLASSVHGALTGNPAFDPLYAASLALLAVAVTVGLWCLARRWASAAGLHHGVLLCWAALATVVSWKVPGASYLLVWPLPVMIAAAMLGSRTGALATGTLWLATIVAIAVVVPITALVCMVLVGVVGPGSIALGVLVALLVLLLLPQFEVMAGDRRFRLSLGVGGAAVLTFAVGAMTVRASAAHPAPSMLIYAMEADSSDSSAWIVGPAYFRSQSAWYGQVFGETATAATAGAATGAQAAPKWLAEIFGAETRLLTRAVPRVAAPGPSITVLSDSALACGRQLTLRILTPPRALSTTVHVADTKVTRAVVDGRVIDTTRFRRPQKEWRFSFAGSPDSGFVLALTVPAGAQPALELTSAWAGLPQMPGITIPARPVGTIPVQNGDVRVVRRRVAF